MHTQLQSTVPSRLSRNNYRTTARLVGVLYLAGMVVGIGGNLFIQSVKGCSTSPQLPSEPPVSSTTPVATPPLVGSAMP
jgi:hypothetical protein